MVGAGGVAGPVRLYSGLRGAGRELDAPWVTGSKAWYGLKTGGGRAPMATMQRGSSMGGWKKPSEEMRLRSMAPYSSRIIKAGALIGDTKTLTLLANSSRG